MSVYVLTPRAKVDIFDIWSHIADDNEGAADRVERAIYDACAFVAEVPMRGHSRPDLTNRSLRFWRLTRYPNYTVVYRPETTPLQVVAVQGRCIKTGFPKFWELWKCISPPPASQD